ncbi:MAG: glutathione S-transferase [Rhodospirillaceae bacterium]|jgi:glutathione S-transferase|nr:glutathione S-transferase [Rhodospirillaceae bacterium]MBT5664861.1 glutathione S-transferase [Rhodospirillaceae bacterium]
MKLFYTPNSPYARVCRIVADAHGLTDALELARVPLRDTASALIPLSAMGRVPVLVNGDLVLSEARHICAYLDEKAGTAPSVAAYGDWPLVASEAAALAFLDAVTVWTREMRRNEDERSPFLLQAEEEQVMRMIGHYDGVLEAPAGSPPLNFETICIAVAMGSLDFYELALNWRDNYLTLAAWIDAYNALPIMRDTVPTAAAMNLFTR